MLPPSPTVGADTYARERRAEIEAALARYGVPGGGAPAVLVAAMRYSLAAGGKRLRPLLTLAGAEAVCGPDARTLALPAACAIEMLHTYSLIHDDLPCMDDDTMRRGRPTLHVVAGEGMAVLAGDGLQAEAFALLAREPVSDSASLLARKLRTLEIIAAAVGSSGMVGGQAIDLDAVRPGPDRPAQTLDADGLENMHARKTGALIRASAIAGAILGGGDSAQVEAIGAYGREIGLAFQIVDDVLDVESGSEVLGKTAGKDAAAGKPTYPARYGLERSRAMALECLARAEAHLASAALDATQLAAIARTIVTRRS